MGGERSVSPADMRFNHSRDHPGVSDSVNTDCELKQGEKTMLVCDYIVERIDGDYALLRRVDEPEEELKQTARVLLPEAIMEGMRLHYEMLEYSIVEE